MSVRINDKQASINWDKFRQSIKKSTPVDFSETAEEKAKRITQLESDPQEWKKYYFKKFFKYESPAFHLKASKRLLNNFLKKRHWYEVRHWARGLSKSTTSMMDILYLVLTGKLYNIILTSSTYDAAEAFLEKYRAQLDSNDRIINDYGKQEMPGSWSMGAFTTRRGVKFLALGARQSPRGNGNEEIRPDCIIVDDFDTDEECLNPDIINKKWDWYEKALFFTVDVSEPYLIIWNGNIIAEDCCVVRAGKMADHCEVINMRDENGVSVWPEKNPEKDIDYQIEHTSYEASQQELFNNPIRQGQVFKEMTYGKCPPIQTLPFVIVYADPSNSNNDKPSQKAKAQNSCKAVVIVGYSNLKFYVYKAFVDTTTNSTFIDWLYAAYNLTRDKTQPYIFIENNTLQAPFYEQVLLPLIFQKCAVSGDILPITPDTRVKPDKYFRIEGTLEPINKMGLLVLNIDEKDDPHMKRLEAQFKSVRPRSTTMDGPDAVEGAVHIAKNKLAIQNDGILIVRRNHNSKRF